MKSSKYFFIYFVLFIIFILAFFFEEKTINLALLALTLPLFLMIAYDLLYKKLVFTKPKLSDLIVDLLFFIAISVGLINQSTPTNMSVYIFLVLLFLKVFFLHPPISNNLPEN